MTKRTKKTNKMSNELKGIYNALNTIVEFFNYEEKGTETDQVTGEVVERVGNRLAFTQRAVLDGLCWKAHAEIARLEGETLPKTAAELISLERRRGSPHGQNVDQQIASKQAYMEKLEDQLHHMQKWFAICGAVYAATVGRDWAPASRRFSTAQQATAAGVNARSAELINRWAKGSGTLHRDVANVNSPSIDDQDARDIH